MAQGQRCRENNQPIERELELIKFPEVSVFFDRLVAREHEPELRLDHAVMAQIRDPQHQAGLAVKRPDGKVAAKFDPGRRSGEAHKNEPRDNREPEHSGHDFDRGQGMAIESGGEGIAVAHRRERLDAKKKRIEQRPLRQSIDAAGAGAIKRGEDEIDQDINPEDKSAKLRPAQREDPVIKVAPFLPPRIDLDELKLPGVDRDLVRFSFHNQPLFPVKSRAVV